MSGNNDFAPFKTNPNTFVVKNITNPKKTIRIFNYPINWNDERDLMQLEGVSSDDIRSSLSKGTINIKLKSKDIIIVQSDIDLLEFNAVQKDFLIQGGITVGYQVTANQLAVLRRDDQQLIGLVNSSNVIFTIPDSIFLYTSQYTIVVYLNGVKQFLGDDYMISESGGVGTGYNTVIFTSPPLAVTPIDVVTADYYIATP